MSEQLKKINEYDAEPVMYCARCYSLNIVYEEAVGTDCCGECGCSDMKTTSIEEWERLYEVRYGHKFVVKTNNYKDSPIFALTDSKLKLMVSNREDWKDLCKTMYPKFPEGLGNTDSVILLFAKLADDNRLDDLRIELINRMNK